MFAPHRKGSWQSATTRQPNSSTDWSSLVLTSRYHLSLINLNNNKDSRKMNFSEYCDSVVFPLYEKEGAIPKCPPGYKFDKEMMMCVPSISKQSPFSSSCSSAPKRKKSALANTKWQEKRARQRQRAGEACSAAPKYKKLRPLQRQSTRKSALCSARVQGKCVLRPQR